MSQRENIMVIDTEESIRSLLAEYFSRLGYRVFPASSMTTALDIMADDPVAVAVLDIGMSGGFDMANLDRLHEAQSDLQVILLTGYPTLDTAVEAIRHGAFDFIIKPFRLEDLRGSVQRAMTIPPAPRVQPLRDRIAVLEDALRRHGIILPDDRTETDEQAPVISERGYSRT